MIPLASDEDFDGRILRGLSRREPDVDIVRIAEAGLLGAPDPEVLAWAADEGRALLTHDMRTMPAHAHARIRENRPMPGVIAVAQIGARPRRLLVGEAIENILLIATLLEPGDLDGQIVYLPL